MKTTKDTFIIITTARTGSNMLIEFLNKQIDIRCEREILKNHDMSPINKINYIYNNPIVYQKIIVLLGNDPNRMFYNRNLNVVKYLNLFLSVINTPIQGFKVYYNSHIIKGNMENEFLKYIKENNVKVIHLTRNNTILQFLSKKLATIGVTNFSSSNSKFDIDKRIKTKIEYNEYIKYRNNLIVEKKQVRDLCELHNLPIHEVTYEQLCDVDYKEHYSNIMKYLNLEPSKINDIIVSGHQNQKKNQKYLMHEIFINTNEFIKDSNEDDIITELEIKTLNEIK
jgi:hypothetical protein